MVNIVINYDPEIEGFKVYEPSTDTIIITKNLTEALLNLSKLLESLGINILEESGEVTYHLDQGTLKTMIDSNVNLLKKLTTSNVPGGFMISERKFGPSTSGKKAESKFGKGFKGSSLGKAYNNFNNRKYKK